MEPWKEGSTNLMTSPESGRVRTRDREVREIGGERRMSDYTGRMEWNEGGNDRRLQGS